MYVQNRFPDIWHVDLVAMSTGVDSTSVRDALLFTGYGALQDSNNDSIITQKTINSEKIQFIKNNSKYKENETFDVIVTHIVNPDKIYVQKVIKIAKICTYFFNNKYLIYRLLI